MAVAIAEKLGPLVDGDLATQRDISDLAAGEWCKAGEFGCDCGRSEYKPCPLPHPRSAPSAMGASDCEIRTHRAHPLAEAATAPVTEPLNTSIAASESLVRCLQEQRDNYLSLIRAAHGVLTHGHGSAQFEDMCGHMADQLAVVLPEVK